MLERIPHLRLILDPSHGTGHRWMVPPLAKAAIAAGADGFLVKVHCDPQQTLSDGHQTLRPDRCDAMMREVQRVAMAIGADLPSPERPLT